MAIFLLCTLQCTSDCYRAILYLANIVCTLCFETHVGLFQEGNDLVLFLLIFMFLFAWCTFFNYSLSKGLVTFVALVQKITDNRGDNCVVLRFQVLTTGVLPSILWALSQPGLVWKAHLKFPEYLMVTHLMQALSYARRCLTSVIGRGLMHSAQ